MKPDEWWWFDFAAPGYGGYADLSFRHGERVAWWSAGFVGAGWSLVAVRAHDVSIPARGTDVRTDGLWASVTAHEVAMEAFGAVFDDPLEAWGDERGDIVPFGYDLEWGDDGAVHGEVLVGDDRIAVDATGVHVRGTGPRLSSTIPTTWGDDGLPTAVEGTTIEALSLVLPSTVHALCRERDRWRWVSWWR